MVGTAEDGDCVSVEYSFGHVEGVEGVGPVDVGWLVKPDADGVDAGIEGCGLPVAVVFASSHPPAQNNSEIRLRVCSLKPALSIGPPLVIKMAFHWGQWWPALKCLLGL